MEYLSRFDFDIRYIKGILNKVSDCLSRYYESDKWNDVHDISEYANADLRLDPEMDDLPWDRVHEISTRVVKMCVSRVQNPQRSKQLEQKLQEPIHERDIQAEALNAAPPPGVSAYARQALHYIADAHDSIIANRVF